MSKTEEEIHAQEKSIDELGEDLKPEEGETLFERLADTYDPIKEIIIDDKAYTEFIKEMTLVEGVIRQVNEIFNERIFGKNNEFVGDQVNQYIDMLITRVHSKYMELTMQNKALPDIPQVGEISEWVEHIYVDICSQIFNPEMVEIILEPSFKDITTAIVEFASEGNEEQEVPNE